MYCPTCGVNQSDDRKFCTACGTNLGAVTAALNGPGNIPAPPAAQPNSLIEAQVQYKRGLASAIQKSAPGVGLLVAALFIFLMLPPGISVWICFGFIIGGFAALGKGIGEYYAARAELQGAELRAQAYLSAAPPASTDFPPASASSPYPQHSITEHTTRHLK